MSPVESPPARLKAGEKLRVYTVSWLWDRNIHRHNEIISYVAISANAAASRRSLGQIK